MRLIDCCVKTKDYAMGAFYHQCRDPINFEQAFICIEQIKISHGKITNSLGDSGSEVGLFWDMHLIEKLIGTTSLISSETQ